MEEKNYLREKVEDKVNKDISIGGKSLFAAYTRLLTPMLTKYNHRTYVGMEASEARWITILFWANILLPFLALGGAEGNVFRILSDIIKIVYFVLVLMDISAMRARYDEMVAGALDEKRALHLETISDEDLFDLSERVDEVRKDEMEYLTILAQYGHITGSHRRLINKAGGWKFPLLFIFGPVFFISSAIITILALVLTATEYSGAVADIQAFFGGAAGIMFISGILALIWAILIIVDRVYISERSAEEIEEAYLDTQY